MVIMGYWWRGCEWLNVRKELETQEIGVKSRFF